MIIEPDPADISRVVAVDPRLLLTAFWRVIELDAEQACAFFTVSLRCLD